MIPLTVTVKVGPFAVSVALGVVPALQRAAEQAAVDEAVRPMPCEQRHRESCQ